MKEKFIITIESFHCADRGTQNNVSEEMWFFGYITQNLHAKKLFVYLCIGC